MRRFAIAVCVAVLVFAAGFQAPTADIQILDPHYRLGILAKDSPLPGCNGAIVGPDGALYVTHADAGTISRLDLATRKATTFVPDYAGIFIPDDITVDDQGNFYVTGTSPLVGDVYRIDPKGKKTVIARGIPGANGIHFNLRTGRLFVSECFAGNRVFEIDPRGVREPKLLVKENVIAIPEGFGFDPDTGDLIIPDLGKDRILRVNPDTGAMTMIAENFVTPVALDVGPDKKAYIVELDTGGVYRLGLDGRHRQKLAQLPPGIDNVALAPDGRLFVTSYWDATVFEVSTDGSGKYQTLFPMGSASIAGILAKGKRILTSDWIMIRSVENGKFVKSKLNVWATREMFTALVTGKVPSPGTMEDGPGDEVFWSDGGSQVAMGNPMTGEFKVLPCQFNGAMGLLMNPERTELYVAEYGAGQIASFSLAQGTKRVVTTGLEGPISMALVEGRLYVAESKAGRISQVDPATGKKEIFLCGMISRPTAMGSDQSGDLLVLDAAGKRLYRIGIRDLSVSVIAANLPIRYSVVGNYPPSESPWPMSIGGDGSIYLGTTRRGVIMLKKVG